MKKSNTEKALSYACRLLNIRPRSEHELKDRLFKKGFGQATVNETVASLKEKGFLDDFKFAILWVESRMRANPKGGMLLRKELKAKGVPAQAIEKALAESKEDESLVAKSLTAREMEKLKGVPKEKVRRRLFGYLARKGFKFDLIEDIVREASRIARNDEAEDKDAE